jgi:hypothetical protein
VSAANGVWTIGLGADESATFECNLDGAGWVACSSTTSYAGMHPGPHTFAARATDSAGNTDPSPAGLSIKFTGNGSGH